MRAVSRAIKRNENIIVKVVSWVLLCICVSGFIFQGVDCFRKWLSCPQGIHLSTKHQTEVDFPSISFCPIVYEIRYGTPLAYDFDKMDECGLDFESIFNGSKPNCHNIWQDLTPKLKDFGLSNGYVKFLDNTIQKLDSEENNSLWRKITSLYRGVCFTLSLSEKMKKKGIYFLHFDIHPDKHFEMLIHPKGIINPMDPLQSLEYSYDAIVPNKSYTHHIVYQQNRALDFGGKECHNNQSYDYLTCLEVNVYKVCGKKLA